MVVTPQHPSLSWRQRERAEDRVRATAHLAVGQDEFDGGRKVFARRTGEAGANFLVGRIEHAVTGEMFPILDPGPTEWALAIKDQERPVEGGLIHARSPSPSGSRASLCQRQ